MKAAEAIYNGIKKYTNHDAHLVDALDYTSPAFKTLYRGTYTNLITYVPWLWGFVFRLLDAPALQSAIRKFRRFYNALNTKGFHKFLKEENFDYIISAHFMPNEVSCALKRQGKITAEIISVITDYDVHKIWLADGIDTYCVASDWTKKKLKSLGINESKIVATGIPSDEKFSQAHDIVELKKKIGIKPDVFTVLIATGSFGIGPIEAIVEKLEGFQVIVICGHNKGLFMRLNAKNYPLVKVCGLVDNMFEMMAVSDVMITKPGGLSVTEALVSQLPLIFFNAIPGQETGNVRVLEEYGIGISDVPIEKIVEELKALKSSKDKFLTALKKTKALARPSAVKDIISFIQ